MEKDQIWFRIVLFYFFCTTFGVVVLVDKIFLGRPFVSLLLGILLLVIYLNHKIYTSLKHQ